MKNPLVSAKEIADRLVRAQGYFAVLTGESLTWTEIDRRVSARLGVKPDSSKLSRIKNGQQYPTIPECAAFAIELRVSKGWLAFGEGPMELPAAQAGEEPPPTATTRVVTPPPKPVVPGAEEERPRRRRRGA